MAARISAQDIGRLDEIEGVLADLQKPAHDPETMQQVVEALGSEFIARFGLSHDASNVELLDSAMSGPQAPAGYLDVLSAGIASGEMTFLFSARMPERAQRNTSFVIDGARRTLRLKRHEAARFGLSHAVHRSLLPGLERLISHHEQYQIADHFQHRTLICDGTLLLCYFNSFQAKEFTPRQRTLYARVVELIRRRALVDHRLMSSSSNRAALDACLESTGRAAFIVDRHGNVRHANALGIEEIDRDVSLVQTLRDAVRGRAVGFDVVSIAERGVAMRSLVLRKRAVLSDVAAVLATELELAPCTRAILIWAAAGEPTKSIAARLGLAANTVEYHLTKIYRKVGVSSRIELQIHLSDRLAGITHPS